MLGTRTHGKTKVYCYYTCYRRARYETTACGGQRIDADAIEDAVTGALACLYRHQHDLIAEAIAAAQANHAAAHDGRRAELATSSRGTAVSMAARGRGVCWPCLR